MEDQWVSRSTQHVGSAQMDGFWSSLDVEDQLSITGQYGDTDLGTRNGRQPAESKQKMFPTPSLSPSNKVLLQILSGDSAFLLRHRTFGGRGTPTLEKHLLTRTIKASGDAGGVDSDLHELLHVGGGGLTGEGLPSWPRPQAAGLQGAAGLRGGRRDDDDDDDDEEQGGGHGACESVRQEVHQLPHSQTPPPLPGPGHHDGLGSEVARQTLDLKPNNWNQSEPRFQITDPRSTHLSVPLSATESQKQQKPSLSGGSSNMSEPISVGVNLDAFSHAINGIQALRSSVSRVFESLKDGMKNRETLEGREKRFISEFQDTLQAVNRDLNELERLSGLVGRPSESHPLHNSGLLSLDPVQDKTPLYSQLLQAYKWSNKLQYHAGLASSLLNQQSLKRSANQMGASAKRRPKVQPSTLVLPPQYVDDVISRVGRMFPDMTIELFRPNGTSAVLLVTLGKVLKAIVVMRSLFIDRTVVRGFNENVYSEDGKVPTSVSMLMLVSLSQLDIWTKSQYLVFQKVTDHATTALLHYQLPQMPDVVTWLRSYIKLFQSSCQRCGRFLQDGLPPTWRDFRTLEAFHDTCRL
ncbi:hypothetical protein CCH79_00020550 [Gambusia affinis]|uniref:Mediator complex subunit 27 n=1 Tax=Gambusia affinis TaxID=33528 RepID=A0A315W2Y7_GAMAF|nr:hypothetical protein CCH79_00020550 [Gambusia affinis]